MAYLFFKIKVMMTINLNRLDAISTDGAKALKKEEELLALPHSLL
jgi:hypothetical protein